LAVLIAIPTLTHHSDRIFSPAIVYLIIGTALAGLLALLDGGWLTLAGDSDVVEHLTELAVIVALFATGLKIDRRISLRGWGPTALLLAVVMPLTILAIVAAGVWGLGLSLGAAIVLGAALSPTDPVLAGDLGVPAPGRGDRSEPAFILSSEAGLNDGLAFPFVYLGLVVASAPGSGDLLEWVAADVVYAIALGLGAGAGLGWLIAAVGVWFREHGIVAARLDGWAPVGAVLVIYGATEIIGAYGFLAAFAGGLAFGRYERGHELVDGVHDGAEVAERALELAAILLLGSMLTTAGLALAGWEAIALGLALILVVRPVLTVVALWRTGLPARERLYVGLFGVRGIGSIYYATAALGSGLLAPDEGALVVWTVAVAVCVSIVLHGVAAAPLTRAMVRGER
ncbi:MAG: cation:proton antiporter, partial [Miltoncostaeaceae bacterium]